MKKLMFFLFAVLLLTVIYGCGSMRISSINHRDDTDLRHGDLGLVNDSLYLANRQLDYNIKQQSFDIEKTSYGQTTTPGWQEGLIINNHLQTQITFEVLRGDKIILDETLTPQSRVLEKLPLGIYTANYYEWYRGVKFKYRTFTLAVTNQTIFHLNGGQYYFVLTN
jgi:hypothetical protein